MNIPLIRKTLKRIEEDYKHFDMGTFHTEVNENYRQWHDKLDCGTVCCFAGEALIVKLGMKKFRAVSYQNIPIIARDLLDLTFDQYHYLFYDINSNHNRGTKTYARDVIRQIRKYVKEQTGEIV